MFSRRVSVEPQYGHLNALLWSWTSWGPPAFRGAGGAKPGLAELLAAFGRDPVGRPRVVEDHLDLGLGAELSDALGHLVAHHLERRAAEEGRRELDVNGAVLDGDVADDAEVDDRDRRDLRVGDLGECLPDGLGGYHVAPATERRTSVISSQSCSNSGKCSPRWSTRGRSSSSAST